ncbi:hypothetical protein BN873_30039 [Candidatus Competibacter denitrificans Run_A_D11]|uniref:Uncharacterized protein n=1 Tax=Candidatus Competibacter denitrificans Run_A_D11 TaxID=1400863 RepID=W6M9D3_9GAMM|nr:hypothetical protein BN873_30039 [Candidatus Competibacter denitrificans Run_A_D11]
MIIQLDTVLSPRSLLPQGRVFWLYAASYLVLMRVVNQSALAPPFFKEDFHEFSIRSYRCLNPTPPVARRCVG